MTLRIHEDKVFAGGMIASLSIPWGYAKGDDDLGGYHLVWTRDLVETVGGLVAAGAQGDAGRVLRYLQVTQEADGHWPQNMWLDGTPYWTGIQMDETAFPILLTETAYRLGVLDEQQLESLWPMVRLAAAYVVANGPVSKEDRWEENAGYSPFTLAVEIAGLLAAASLAEAAEKQAAAQYLRETADNWNANIERWTYVTGTELAEQHGVEGYYVRISPPDVGDGASIREGYVPIKNRPPGESKQPAVQIVSPDALALVRFGLRAPDDPRILNTVKVIDAMLKVDTPNGPVWHRYKDDGYGDKADGEPFDGTGIGRGWPLLVGERAHYELAAGHFDEAERLMQVMEGLANEGGMIPEQTWDAPDIPDRELFFGRPAGSAMPLVWAHAEYLKLRRSLREHRVIDMPPQPVDRYLRDGQGTPFTCWRFNQKPRKLPAGKILRVETRSPAVVHWSADGWQTAHDCPTVDTPLSMHVADLPTTALSPASPSCSPSAGPRTATVGKATNYEVQLRPDQDSTGLATEIAEQPEMVRQKSLASAVASDLCALCGKDVGFVARVSVDGRLRRGKRHPPHPHVIVHARLQQRRADRRIDDRQVGPRDAGVAQQHPARHHDRDDQVALPRLERERTRPFVVRHDAVDVLVRQLRESPAVDRDRDREAEKAQRQGDRRSPGASPS